MRTLLLLIIINGCQRANDIADTFCAHYANTFTNSADNTVKVNLFNEMRLHYTDDTGTDTLVQWKTLKLQLVTLKRVSAAVDSIVLEHIIHSHPSLIVHLKLLFHMMLEHGYVPDNFCTGIIVPSVKHKCGDISSVENYRQITLSPVISKMFESVLVIKYGMYLDVNDRQFGFRKNLACRNAIFVLRNVIDYFNERGSNVYLT